MANKTAAVAAPQDVTYTAEMGDFNGQPTWSVGVEGAHPKSRLGHTLNKWGRLFSVDPDGDANLFNLFLAVYGAAESHDAASSLRESALLFVRQFLDWDQDRTGGGDEDATEEPEAQAEPDVVEAAPTPSVPLLPSGPMMAQALNAMCPGLGDMLAQLNAAHAQMTAPAPKTAEPTPASPLATEKELGYWAKQLKHQVRWGGKASQEELARLANDCWSCLRQGMPFTEYRDCLNKYGSAAEYLADSK